MQEFRPLEKAVSKTARLLSYWDEYARELRAQKLNLTVKSHLLILLSEHPLKVWQTVDALVKDSGYLTSVVVVALDQLAYEGKLIKKWTVHFATKERANNMVDPGWDFNFNHSTKSVSDMFSELEKILNDACLKVTEAVKINEQLFNLEQNVTSSKNTAIR